MRLQTNNFPRKSTAVIIIFSKVLLEKVEKIMPKSSRNYQECIPGSTRKIDVTSPQIKIIFYHPLRSNFLPACLDNPDWHLNLKINSITCMSGWFHFLLRHIHLTQTIKKRGRPLYLTKVPVMKSLFQFTGGYWTTEFLFYISLKDEPSRPLYGASTSLYLKFPVCHKLSRIAIPFLFTFSEAKISPLGHFSFDCFCVLMIS